MFKKHLLISCFFVAAIAGSLQAQYREKYYDVAAGLRLGTGSGLTGKMFISNRLAIEGLITTRWEGLNITGLFEVSYPIADTPGLSWYYGLGANVGFWDFEGNKENKTEFFIGVDGIIGMEYTFDDFPLNISLDWKPFLNIISHTDFVGDEFALSVRYVIR